MNGIEIMTVFFSGMVFGAAATIIGVLHIGHKSLKKTVADKKSISDRLAKVKELTEFQLEMQGAASGPQKNALDGKYKNGLNATFKKIEEEKAEILQSILNDGHDPEVTVQGPDGLEKMKLSAFLVQQGYDSTPKSKVEKAITKPKNPFTVVKGGKSDDGGDGQTFH